MNAPETLTRELSALLAEGLQDGAFHVRWLTCVLKAAGDIEQAVLVLGEQANRGPFVPVALWPEGRACASDLAALCEQALEMRVAVNRRGGGRALLAIPVILEGDLHGVVALAAPSIQPALRDWLQWGMGWLLVEIARSQGNAAGQLRERLLLTLELTMAVLEESDFAAAVQTVATDVAVRLGCDRVAIGFGDGGLQRAAAISHSADFTRRVDLTQALEAAMNEAAEQGARLQVEDGLLIQEEGGGFVTAREHLRLARDFGAGSLLSVPFAVDDKRNGVFLFEWAAEEIPAEARQQAEGLVPILGRILLDRRHGERGVWQRIVDACRLEVTRLLGPMHALRKLIAFGVLALVVFFTVATGDHRVAANATLEGAIRRVVVAPFDGFVTEAGPRAGQEVRAGDHLVTLDDRDLRLETQRWASQEEQYRRQAADAEAQSNLAQIQIALAQTRQAAAQRELSEAHLARSRITAPFDAVIVAGDLSQHLGGAVRKGQTLFELAPLDAYRIVFEVEESDIARVAVGQRGELVVTALTDRSFPFSVSLVTPVATAREGRNFFRVEATLDQQSPHLRPGMEGIGKIVIGERRLIWIWTHRMVDWLRLQTWIWLGI